MEVKRVLLVTHPAPRMYDLIEGAEHYPEFLPWCARAVVTERSDAIVAADIVVDWHGARFEFSTRNEKRRPHWMGVRLARGPFRRFEGEWHLTPLGDEGCRIAFQLHYDFDNAVLRAVAGHMFERITNTLMDAFVARADALGPAIPVPRYVGAAVPLAGETGNGSAWTTMVPAAPSPVGVAPGAPAPGPLPVVPAASGSTFPETAASPLPPPFNDPAQPPHTATPPRDQPT